MHHEPRQVVVIEVLRIFSVMAEHGSELSPYVINLPSLVPS